jgi:hypothetical protein
MHAHLRLAAIAAVSLVARAATADGPAALPAHASAHGADLATWMQRFFEWEGRLPVVDGSHPYLDLGDVDCSRGQDGPVWFLELPPTLSGDLERRCAVPVGTAFYVPVLQWVCPPALSGLEVADCLAQADGVFALLDLGLTVDGRALDDDDLAAYRVRTPRFDLAIAADSVWDVFCGCDLGTSLDFAADGIGALIGPLPPGPHTITIRYASEAFGFTGSLTYRLDVTPGA